MGMMIQNSPIPKALRGFEFNPGDYAQGGRETLFKEACGICVKHLGRALTQEDVQDIWTYLSILYGDLKMNSAGDLTTDVRGLFPGDTVSCRIGNSTVRGAVDLSPKHLSVHLLGPGPDPYGELHIKMIAPYIFTQEPLDDSPANETGLEKTKRLLVDLYYDSLTLAFMVKSGESLPEIKEACHFIKNTEDIVTFAKGSCASPNH